jgi:hypothetical protein
MLRGSLVRASRSKVTAWRARGRLAVTQTKLPTIPKSRSAPTTARRRPTVRHRRLLELLRARPLDASATANRPAASHIVSTQRVLLLGKYATSSKSSDRASRGGRLAICCGGCERPSPRDEQRQSAHSRPPGAGPAGSHSAIAVRRCSLRCTVHQERSDKGALRLSLLWRYGPRQRRVPLDGAAGDSDQEQQLVEPLSRL